MTSNTFLSPPDNYTGPKRSLVIAGGGMRVAYQAGVLRSLQEANIYFDHGDGTSGGTINLAMLLSGLSSEEMCTRWRTLDVKYFVSLMPLQQYFKAHDMLAMGDSDGIINKVFPHLGIDIAKINQAQGMLGTFNVCNYTQKTNQAIHHSQLNMALLVAGISLPIFMPPVEVDHQLYIDSVWIKDANLMEAVKRGAEEIWLVWCIGNTPSYHTGAFNQYVHMIEMSANGGLNEEFDRINELNQSIKHGYSPYGQKHPIKLHVIKPQHPLPLDPELYLGRIDANTLISMGYTDTRNYIKQLQSDGLAFSPSITQMQEISSVGISFRESMSGPFALDNDDHAIAAVKGEVDGTELSINLTISISDIEEFIQDPNYQGHIYGSVDFTPFGKGLPSSGGIFNLFTAAHNPKLKLMIYELAFFHQGQDYYLAGQKQVKDDPGFDLWSDTTTLYTKLHKGVNKSAPVIGAGILLLSIKDLVKLVSKLTVTNSQSTAEKINTYAKFGSFFMGELWDNYKKFSNQDE
jgi:predicted patatin/cPLA2 family phospholipase